MVKSIETAGGGAGVPAVSYVLVSVIHWELVLAPVVF